MFHTLGEIRSADPTLARGATNMPSASADSEATLPFSILIFLQPDSLDSRLSKLASQPGAILEYKE